MNRKRRTFDNPQATNYQEIRNLGLNRTCICGSAVTKTELSAEPILTTESILGFITFTNLDEKDSKMKRTITTHTKRFQSKRDWMYDIKSCYGI